MMSRRIEYCSAWFCFICSDFCCRAAELMTRTGSVVTLEVAKQGAIYHGLATLLNQPSPMMQRGKQTKIILYIAITVLFMT